MFSKDLEHTIGQCYKRAREARHEYMTVEHLLLALLDNPSAEAVLKATSADIPRLRADLEQSIADVLTTPIGSRVMRREYGSQLIDLIDWPLNSATRLQAYAATAMALMRWEPRIRLSRVQLSLGDVAGQAILDLEGTLTDSNEPLSLRVPLSLGAAA